MRHCLRGFSRIDLVALMALGTALVGAIAPVIASGTGQAGMVVSLSNMRRIGAGCASYEADWGGRQWSCLEDRMADFGGDCATYTVGHCPPQLILGYDAGNSALWGYWIRGGLPTCTGWPGSCATNWIVLMPITLGGTTGPATDYGAGVGTWQFINARGVREYIANRHYDPVFYAPNDVDAYDLVQGRLAGVAAEFHYPADSYRISSYGLSPAAMWGPGTFRAPSAGGFVHPSENPAAFSTPTASSARHPTLKTRLMERNWCQNPPTHLQAGQEAGRIPYASNASGRSRPGCLFFDGHAAFVSMESFAADDAMAQMQTGDGLWSRDTAYGPLGVFGAQALDGFANSAHLLTIDGVQGRDLLHQR